MERSFRPSPQAIRFSRVRPMRNAEQPVKDCADYVTTADNNHDGVAEAVEKFILRED